jgi:AcrR family transcriptional regulator
VAAAVHDHGQPGREREGRPLTGARDRILDTAARLFYARGVRGVGIDTIIAESGVAKATLYAHFRAKDDLVVAYLARADDAWRGKLADAAAAAGPRPRDRLVGLFDALTATCAEDGFRGCAFVNTAAEYEPGSVAFAATVAHKRAVRAWVRELAVQAGASNPDALAGALTVLLDGALTAAALEPRAEGAVLAGNARDAARVLVDAATASASVSSTAPCPPASPTAAAGA